MSSQVSQLGFRSTQKKFKFVIIHESYGYNEIPSLREQLFFSFPIWFYFKTLICDGGHLGFLTDNEKKKCRGPYKDHSY